MLPTGKETPDRLKSALDRYATTHTPVGGFLTAVLSNDLAGAFAKADPASVLYLHDIIGYCHNELPSKC